MRTLLTALALLIGAQVVPMAAADVADTAGLTAVADTLRSVGTADAAFIRRLKIRRKRTSGYRLVVNVDDDGADEVHSVTVTIDHGPDQPIPEGGETTCGDDGNCRTRLTVKELKARERSRKRFVFTDNFSIQPPDDTGFNTTTTMHALDGRQIGEGFSGTVVVEEPGDVRIRSVTIRQIDDVNFRVKAVIVDDLEDEIGQAWVTIDDYDGPDPEPDDSFAIANPIVKAEGKKVFKHNTLMFSDPVAAIDQVYTLVVDLRDASGENSLGTSFHNVVVDGLDQPNQCADGVLNGQEQAIDCGGSECAPCEIDDLLAQLEDERATRRDFQEENDWIWDTMQYERARFTAGLAESRVALIAAFDDRDVAIAEGLEVSVDELRSFGPGTTTILNSETYDDFILSNGGPGEPPAPPAWIPECRVAPADAVCY